MDTDYLGDNLVFLISQPRAGSTLLQRVLASHPLVQTSAEPWLMLHPIYALKESGHTANYNASGAYDGLQDFLTHYGDGVDTYVEALRAFAQVLYARALTTDHTNKKYFLDKTPRYYYIIPELQRIFPDAKFVFLLRNPLAILASILATWVGDNWPGIAYWRDDLLLAPQKILEGIDALRLSGHVVYYEQLVEDPESTISQLCWFLDLTFSRELLTGEGTSLPRGRFGDPQSHTRPHGPAIDSLNKWVRLGDNPQTRHFALAYLNALGVDLIDGLGYSAQELEDGLNEFGTQSHLPIIPWDTAIRHSDKWSREDRLRVAYGLSVQQKVFCEAA